MMMKKSDIRWGYAASGSLAALVMLGALAFLYMVIYGHVVQPGESQAFYEAHARKSSPVVGFLLGPVLFFFLGRRARNAATALALWGFFAVAVIGLTLVSPDPWEAAMVCLADLPVKGAALWWGYRWSLRHAAA